MKKILILLLLAAGAQRAAAQQTITINDLNAHIGDSVTVCAKIYGGIFLQNSKNTPTLLNAGAAYPNNPLTILLWADARAQFKDAPEVFYKDKEVCVTGKLILYKEKPEIVVYSPAQITAKQ